MKTNLLLKRELSTKELLLLESELKNQGKSMLVAYILWYFLGMFGGHRFYMGRTGTAVSQLILSVTIIGLIVTSIWWIVDAFLLHIMVLEYNQEIEVQLIDKVLSSRRNEERI